MPGAWQHWVRVKDLFAFVIFSSVYLRFSSLLRSPSHFLLFSLCYSLLFPCLLYCDISWGPSYPSCLTLFTLRNCAIRIVVLIGDQTCSWCIIYFPCFVFVCLKYFYFLFRFHLNLLPISCKYCFTMSSTIHVHLSRYSLNFQGKAVHVKIKKIT